MTLLHIHSNAIHDFKTENLVNYSQFGVLFWLTEEQQKRVEEFEKQSGNLVYHVIENHYVELGRMLTFLYVSPYMDEWERDRKELAAGEPLAYVANAFITMMQMANAPVSGCTIELVLHRTLKLWTSSR